MSLGFKRFLKYLSVGGSTFLFDLVLLYGFINYAELGYLWASGLSFCIAISINFYLSQRFVFKKSERNFKDGYINFLIIAGAGLLLVISGMYLLVSILGLNYLISRIGIGALTGFANYLLNLFVNFKVAGKH